jgi:hypothetical protein
VILVFVALLILLESFHSAQVSAHTEGFFGPACGLATIDGEVEEAEWTTAAVQTITMLNPATITPTFTATMQVMNGAHSLYLGLTINDDELTPMGEFLPEGDSFLFYFDNDHSGILFEPEDDVLHVNAGLPQFRDQYVVGTPAPTSNQPDVNGGGTRDGTGAASRIGGFNHFELKHPLCSGDSLDFCLKPGDLVGFQLTYHDAQADGSFGGGYLFPGLLITSTADIMIGDCAIPDLFVFLPILLR